MTRPWLILYLFVFFLQSWWCTRNALYFLAGFPAVLVVATMVVVFAVGRRPASSDSDRRENYFAAVRSALNSEEFEPAELYLRRLIHMDPRQDQYRYLLAVCAERQEQRPLARVLMQHDHFHLSTSVVVRVSPNC